MTCDYIIVGAGSAGCVLANRLSADPANHVVLVEAGGRDTHPLIGIPGGYMRLHRSSVDWSCYYTEPQKELNGRRIYQPRGKVLGGSSSTNAMAYIRGQKEDYDYWSQLGCVGWSYNEVLSYFKKSEHNEQLEDEFHARGGLLNVTQAYWYHTPLGHAFIEACIQNGLPGNDDVNGARQEGAGWFQYTMKNGRRVSAANAFLAPAAGRKNLSIVTGSTCHHIMLSGTRAVGVKVKTSKSYQEIRARKEVIVSAGAFESPKLLLLSGIGPREELLAHGIPMRKELPGVGKNLHDHLFYPVSSLCSKPVSNNRYLSIHKQLIELARYMWTKSGPLSIGPLEAVAFLKSSDTETSPDIQFQFTPTNPGNDRVADMYDLSTFPHNDGYTILPTQVRPSSRGTIRLRNADPASPPVIDPNYLGTEEDRKILVTGGRKALEVLEAKAFEPFRIRTHFPDPRSSDEDWLRHIRQCAECVYHPVGTCKMGIDEMAVVDPGLRVYGVENIRIVDASIMPRISSGNTNAPTIMIAEKAADLILNGK